MVNFEFVDNPIQIYVIPLSHCTYSTYPRQETLLMETSIQAIVWALGKRVLL